MESGKRSRSASTDTKKVIEKTKPLAKCKFVGEKKTEKRRPIKEEPPQRREKVIKASMIPVLKCEKIDLKNIMKKPRQSPEPPKLSCSCKCNAKEKQDDDYELKLKVLEEKEKSIAEYYLKIEDTLRQMVVQREQKEKNDSDNDKTPQNNCARKMTSDPAVFSSNKPQNNALSDFENNVEQISSIWLKTSADLYKTLKNLKKNPSLDPMEFEVENARIQLAIKQAKSLTLVKTRSVIAEAKKLYNHGEMIRTELEKLLSHENLKLEDGRRGLSQGECQEKVEEVYETVTQDNFERKGADGTGDTTKESQGENIKEVTSIEDIEKEKEKQKQEHREKLEEEDEPVKECTWPQEKAEPSDESNEKQIALPKCTCTSSEIMAEEVETLAAELVKKNETITNLNNRIFELQKACNEHLLKYNQLQVKLSEFHEKIQWNQVLWKQIGKLKERILGLQQSNKQLEANKKELESKITKLDKELERLIKLNHLLNQRKYLLSTQECSGKECRIREAEEKYIRNEEYDDVEEERILSDKQNAINHLKTVLGAMKDQENFAQKQIAMFQSKIEALEKKSDGLVFLKEDN